MELGHRIAAIQPINTKLTTDEVRDSALINSPINSASLANNEPSGTEIIGRQTQYSDAAKGEIYIERTTELVAKSEPEEL